MTVKNKTETARVDILAVEHQPDMPEEARIRPPDAANREVQSCLGKPVQAGVAGCRAIRYPQKRSAQCR